MKWKEYNNHMTLKNKIFVQHENYHQNDFLLPNSEFTIDVVTAWHTMIIPLFLFSNQMCLFD